MVMPHYRLHFTTSPNVDICALYWDFSISYILYLGSCINKTAYYVRAQYKGEFQYTMFLSMLILEKISTCFQVENVIIIYGDKQKFHTAHHTEALAVVLM